MEALGEESSGGSFRPSDIPLTLTEASLGAFNAATMATGGWAKAERRIGPAPGRSPRSLAWWRQSQAFRCRRAAGVAVLAFCAAKKNG